MKFPSGPHWSVLYIFHCHNDKTSSSLTVKNTLAGSPVVTYGIDFILQDFVNIRHYFMWQCISAASPMTSRNIGLFLWQLIYPSRFVCMCSHSLPGFITTYPDLHKRILAKAFLAIYNDSLAEDHEIETFSIFLKVPEHVQ